MHSASAIQDFRYLKIRLFLNTLLCNGGGVDTAQHSPYKDAVSILGNHETYIVFLKVWFMHGLKTETNAFQPGLIPEQ